MARQCFTVALFFLASVFIGMNRNAIAQSLVLNYSFEDIESCDIELSALANGWTHATVAGTPDLFNACAVDPIFRVPNVFQGCDTLDALTGDGYAGQIVYGNFAREYLQAAMERPLQKGEQVYVAFHVSPSVLCIPSLARFTDAIGLAFSNEQLLEDLPQTGNDVLTIDRAVENRNVAIDDVGNWTRLENCYSALGGEAYVVIGSFVPDDETLLEAPAPWSVVQNYLFVDDIIVTPFDPLPDTVLMCHGEAELSAEFFDHTLRWSAGSSGPSITVSQPGSYVVALDLDNCSLYDTVVVIDASEMTAFVKNDTLCPGEAILLNSPVSGNYNWSTGSMASSIRVNSPGIYRLTVTNACGQVEGRFNVNTDGCECAIYVASVFSPNGDGINDLLNVNINCNIEYSFSSFTVYDRWGGKVFESTDALSGWDGMIAGVMANPGTYVWQLVYETAGFSGLERHVASGAVNVLR